MNEQLEALQDAGVICEMETRDAQTTTTRRSPTSTPSSTTATATRSSSRRLHRRHDPGRRARLRDRQAGHRLRPRREHRLRATFIHPIGGFAYGIDTAEFLVDNLEEGDKVVALRILPGVDVLEHRWAAAEQIFDETGIEAVDDFTGADPTEIKNIITDELATGDVHGIWMDAGDGAVAAIEAFEDAGADYPVMTGEDEMSFLRKWEETGLTGLAPVYSPTSSGAPRSWRWRRSSAGEEVPKEWVLPQEPITDDERGDFLEANDGMPDGHYAKFGGEDLPGYPEVWQERQIP